MKYVRNAIKRAGKAIKKRYTAKAGGRKSTGGYRVGKMAKDILYLKSVLNPEKKRYEDLVTNQPIGQVNGNFDGLYLRDVTPTPNVGGGYSERNGASIKLHSSIYHFQFSQQPSCVAKMKGIIEIYHVLGDPYTSFNFSNERFDPNPFTTVRDYNCQINPDNFMKAKCVARRRFTMLSDGALGTEKLVTDIKIPIKYNKGQGHHVRYDKNSTSTIANGQLYLVIRTDRGNFGVVSTLNVPDTTINTGLLMQMNRVDYYYDN